MNTQEHLDLILAFCRSRLALGLENILAAYPLELITSPAPPPSPEATATPTP